MNAGKTGIRSRIGRAFDGRPTMAVEVSVVTLYVASGVTPVVDTVVLALLATFVVWTRRSSWREFGLFRPTSWPKTVLAGVVLGSSFQLFNIFLLEPVLGRMIREPIDLKQFEYLHGNLIQSLVMLVAVWLLAGFGEEMVYRGYLLKRITDLLGGTKLAWAVAIVFTSVIFGYLGHSYQGTVGAIEATVVATTTCGLFLYSGKNLWLPIIFHGCYDSLSLALLYAGLYPLT